MKDYLNSEERKEVMAILHLISEGQYLIDGNTLTNVEKGNIKRGFSFTKKAIESLQCRLNEDAKKALSKDAKNYRVYLDIYNATEEFARKKRSEINAAYEENKDYYKLVELILYYNCKNCKRHCTECEIYKEFEEHCIPEFSGAKNTGNCRYSYEE